MVWCGVVWCGVVWCGVVWYSVVWCGVVWYGVVWCGVVWWGVVWCGVLLVSDKCVTDCSHVERVHTQDIKGKSKGHKNVKISKCHKVTA